MYNTLIVTFEKSEMISFGSSVMNKIVVSEFSCQARYSVKLARCIALSSPSSA